MKTFLAFALFVLAAGGAIVAQQPNVIVFFVDDLGWTDLGCFGSDFYETPNIDRLAAEGVSFSQAYSACTVCSPSRAALLTGQYPARLRVTDFIPGHPIENTPLRMPDWTQRLKLSEITLAEILSNAGYRTAHLGKWHLTPRERNNDPNDDGNFPEFYPDKQGFQFNLGGCERGAPASYFWPYGRGRTLQQRNANNVFRTLPAKLAGEGTYLTDQLADQAVSLIDAFRKQPFFIYFPFYNVHTPLEGRPDLVEKYRKKLAVVPDVRHKNIAYAAMIESVDQAIGRVMDRLTMHNMSDRTLVIFSSDNGGLYPQATTNTPLRQGKGSIYEGGVRVPTIIRWPNVVKAGARCAEPAITMDFFPTILEATKTKAPPAVMAHVDGLSLLPLVRSAGSAKLDRDAIFWHYPHYHMLGAVPYSAVRMGDWKLIERHNDAPVELYHLAEDIHEDRNLAAEQPARTARMRKRLNAWREDVGAQMAVRNPDYDPSRPTGWKRDNTWREMAAVRE